MAELRHGNVGDADNRFFSDLSLTSAKDILSRPGRPA
jgi:hypothetical protein